MSTKINKKEEQKTIAVVSTKGGVGKSTVVSVLPIIADSEFQIIEVDNNNNSGETYSESELYKEKHKTVKTKKVDGELDEVFMKQLNDVNKKNIYLDGGGGDDTKSLVSSLKFAPNQESIKYVIPLDAGTDIKNIRDTYNLIENKSNVMFCLNRYIDIDNLKTEFFNLFGDERLGVKGFIDEVENKTMMIIPHSPLFIVGKQFNLTLLDLARFKDEFKNNDEAFLHCKEKANDDFEEQKRLYARYRASCKAAELVAQIKENPYMDFS